MPGDTRVWSGLGCCWLDGLSLDDWRAWAPAGVQIQDGSGSSNPPRLTLLCTVN